MKYLKYAGLYFIIIAIGHSVLKMAEAGKIWTSIFYGGAVLWYMARIWEEGS